MTRVVNGQGRQGVELEFHQLDLCYERLRARRPAAERRLLASLADVGQQQPIVVVDAAQASRFVLVDGYKRVRALRQLHADTALATRWDLTEAEALVVDRLMRSSDGATALEQGWLLEELVVRFGLSLHEMARRFSRSVSWVSRRLALVTELPDEVQERVRSGEIVAHAAEKYLVPLARANAAACCQLVGGIAGKGLSSRQIGSLYEAWRDASSCGRERIESEPLLCVRARERVQSGLETPPVPTLLDELDILGAVARRVGRRLCDGAWGHLLAPERAQATRRMAEAHHAFECLRQSIGREMRDAGSGDETRHSAAGQAGS